MPELPKQDLLAKLLAMTTSPNDSEALVAIRKANLLLSAAGWTWDKLIAGKITVIADPFSSAPEFKPKAPDPTPAPDRRAAQQSQQAYAKAQAQTTSAPPKSSPPPPRKPVIGSTKSNLYSGWCYCCGAPVDQQAGFIFTPNHNHPVKSWKIACAPCNKDPYISIPASPAPRMQVRVTTPHLGQL